MSVFIKMFLNEYHSMTDLALSRRRYKMNKTHRRIISGAIVAVCAYAGISAASAVSRKASPDAVPAATTLYSDETPVIILDAGHGGSD